jgi:hypothetical protein
MLSYSLHFLSDRSQGRPGCGGGPCRQGGALWQTALQVSTVLHLFTSAVLLDCTLFNVLCPSRSYPRTSGDIPYAYHHKPGDQCVDPVTHAYIKCQVRTLYLSL